MPKNDIATAKVDSNSRLYVILEAWTAQELADRVTKALWSGWTLVGGLIVTPASPGKVPWGVLSDAKYTQAMQREKW